MALIICPNCERVIRHNDEVVATVVSRYKELASKKAYAIDKPHDCLDMRHKNCNHPQGLVEGD